MEVKITPDVVADPAKVPAGVVEDGKGGVRISTEPPAKAETPAVKQPWEEAGFKDAGELAKAYGELRAKMSAPKTTVETPAPKAETPSTTIETPPTEAEQALAREIARDIQQAAGGEEKYKTVTEWAKTNLKPEEIEEYNEVMASGKKNLAKLAVQGLVSRYTEALGNDGQLVDGDGTPSVSGIKPFESTAQVIAAMSDKRYKAGDTAYIKEVEKRLSVSKVL